MAAKIKKGDKVVVLTGRDKGRGGEVLQVCRRRPRRRARDNSSSAISARRKAGSRHHLSRRDSNTYVSRR